LRFWAVYLLNKNFIFLNIRGIDFVLTGDLEETSSRPKIPNENQGLNLIFFI
jgi:hypothetical protein